MTLGLRLVILALVARGWRLSHVGAIAMIVALLAGPAWLQLYASGVAGMWGIAAPALRGGFGRASLDYSFVLALWSALYIVALMWRDRELTERATMTAEIRARDAELQVLRYQLNPHFVFNALNSIRALIPISADDARGLVTERWKLDIAELEAKDGRVSHPVSGRSFGYGELASAVTSFDVIREDEVLTPLSNWRTLGTNTRKVDGIDFVTGRRQYTSDLSRPGMLYGRVKRPPTAGAVLVSADFKEAASLSGVQVVRDGDFVGVIATSSKQATEALGVLKTSWTPTQGPDSRTVFDYFRTVRAVGELPGRTRLPPLVIGSARDVTKTAPHQVQASYTVAYIAHAPLEPRATIAEWSNDKLTVWIGTQHPFPVRDEIAGALGIPPDNVRVIVPDTGSAYGGKHTDQAAIEAARLARAAKRPVKVVWTREEEFSSAYFRPAGVIDVCSGVQADGRILAFEFDSYNAGPAALHTNYDFPNQRIEMHPTVSPLRVGSYRALAATANHFARETHLDEVAHALGLDPLELRLKNLTDSRQRAVLEAAAARAAWANRRQSGRFLGLACGYEKGSYVATIAEIVLDSARKTRVSHMTTAFECGARGESRWSAQSGHRCVASRPRRSFVRADSL